MFRDRVKELRRVRAGDLAPSPQNWRQHPEQQRSALTAVLAEVGYADALIVRELPDGQLEIVDGHLRSSIDADAVVPVLVVDLDDREAATVLATLDPLAAMAVTDEAALRALLEGIGGADDPLRRLAEAASASALPPATRPKLDDEEEPQPRGEPTTQPGDVWRLGEHRLICGDSFEPETLARLLEGTEADAVVTDPPFAIYGSSTGIASDIADDKMVRPFFEQMGRAIAAHVKWFGHVYVHCDWRSYSAIWEGMKSAPRSRRRTASSGTSTGRVWAITGRTRTSSSPTSRSSPPRAR